MSTARRTGAALAVSLALLASGPAGAQPSDGLLARPASALSTSASNRSAAPDFRMVRGDFRETDLVVRDELVPAIPVATNLHLRLGRFRIIEPARPRTHLEAERAPTDMHRRERGIAAVGLSYRFRQ